MRPARSIITTFLLAAALLAGCSGPADTAGVHRDRPIDPARSGFEGGPADGALIVRLESRRFRILIAASPRGPLYTVYARDGELLVPPMTMRQLHAWDVDLYDEIFGAYADPTTPALLPGPPGREPRDPRASGADEPAAHPTATLMHTDPLAVREAAGF